MSEPGERMPQLTRPRLATGHHRHRVIHHLRGPIQMQKEGTRKKMPRGKKRRTRWRRKVKTGHRVGVCGKSGNADDSDLCVVCSRAVTMSQHGLQCDGCEYWHHANCDKVDDDVYSFLCSHNKDPSLLWYCRKCVAMPLTRTCQI